MDINLQTGPSLPLVLPGSGPDIPTPKADNAPIPQPVKAAAQTPSDEVIEQKRFSAVQRAAQNLFKDVYAVSDTTFSIYKDSSGQYITRYFNLRDGKVTYIPEPRLLQYENHSSPPALIEIQA